jgi:tetratricopeptide (TPR) repeat protein
MDQKTQQQIRSYMKDKRFLVVDGTTAGKTAIEVMLKKSAVARKNVSFMKTLSTALSDLEHERQHYVITQQNIDGELFTDLFKLHDELRPSKKESGFIIITEDDSPNNLNNLAMMGIDTVIIAPYTVTSMQTEFLKVIIEKSTPSPYEEGVSKIKEYLKFDVDKALGEIQKVKKLDDKPFEVLYLEGAIAMRSKSLEEAKKCLNECLDHNPKYYRALKDLFHIHLMLKDKNEAYKISQSLTEDFPISSDLIPDLAWVSVACAKYDDIIAYHEAYKEFDKPEDAIRDHIAASLVIYGKNVLQNRKAGEDIPEDVYQRAIDLLIEAANICHQKPLVYVSIIMTLREYKITDRIAEVMSMATKKFPKNLNIKMVQVLVDDCLKGDQEAYESAKNAITMGLNSPEIFEVLIKRAKALNLAQDIQDAHLAMAIETYPNLADDFKNLV